MKVAWLYDFLATRGGAEAVTLELAAENPEVDFFFAFSAEELAADAIKYKNISFLSKKPAPKIAAIRNLLCSLLFWRHAVSLQNYDLVIVSGDHCFTAITSPHRKRYRVFLHTVPPVYAFKLHDFYTARFNALLRPLFKLFCLWKRHNFKKILRHSSKTFANSKFVAKALELEIGDFVEAEVMYPPIDFSRFPPAEAQLANTFLVVGALEPHKRIALVIDAFKKVTDKELVIIGEGSLRPQLEAMCVASNNIRFLGSMPARDTRRLISSATAVICVSKEEAFGIVALEAIYYRRQILAVHEGAFAEVLRTYPLATFIPSTSQSIYIAINKLSRNNLTRAGTRISADITQKCLTPRRFLENIAYR